jgi:deoxyguanosine kinase
MKEFAHRFLSIEGNIGAGKTTLCQKMSEDFGCTLILEQFTDNPFLPYFYQNPERFAFQVELFFMTERHKQLQDAFSKQDIFNPNFISDYFFIKTLLFARNNLKDEEYRLFQRLFNVLNNTFPKPELLVYLHRSPEILIDNIQKRGRTYETGITLEYLTNIQKAYFDFFRSTFDIPILIIDLQDTDFVEDTNAYQVIVEALNQKYINGIHQFDIFELINN